MIKLKDLLKEEKPGLWANIRAKQARGEKPAHGNSDAHKDAVKAGKEINKEVTLTEKKYYVTYNKGRGQGKDLEKEFDQKTFKTTNKPKVFNSYNDAKKYAEKMEKMFRNSIGGGTAYWVSDEKMNQIKESVNEDTRRVKLLGIDFNISEMNGRIFFSFVDKKAASLKIREIGTNKIVNLIQKSLDNAYGKGEFFFKGGDHAEFQNGYLFQRNLTNVKLNKLKFESVNEETYKVAGRPVTLIKGKKSNGTDWKVKFQNGEETSLSDVIALIKPFPKDIKESELKGYLAADVVDDIVKTLGSKMVKGHVENAPNKNYIYLKLTDIKFGNDVVKMLKSKFGIDAKVDKTFGNMPTVSFASKKVVSEAKSDYAVYHKTYTSAINTAREYAEKKGYEIDDDDAFRQIGMGPRKPSDGKTNRFSIQLTKDGKPQKKHLHIQVYGMGTYKRNPDGSKTRSMWGGQNEYELNAYIN